jgi:hypothetical protein
MQIPYDLEFVENRPVVAHRARAMALPEPYGTWRGAKSRSEEDTFDALLRWVHRMISRLESRSS